MSVATVYCIHICLMVTCFAIHFDIDSQSGPRALRKVDPKPVDQLFHQVTIDKAMLPALYQPFRTEREHPYGRATSATDRGADG